MQLGSKDGSSPPLEMVQLTEFDRGLLKGPFLLGGS